jgi:hypothetical protein
MTVATWQSEQMNPQTTTDRHPRSAFTQVIMDVQRDDGEQALVTICRSAAVVLINAPALPIQMSNGLSVEHTHGSKVARSRVSA